MNLHLRIGLLSLLLVGCGITTLRAETPEEWVKLGARVHGGFGAFIPVGIRIGEDAMKCLNAQPRELSVVYYSGEGVPCPCSVDGVMLAVSATPGKVLFRSRWRNRHPALSPWLSSGPARGGDGLKYTVPMSHMAKLGEINRTIQDPLARYDAVMGIGDLFVVEPIAK